jgi:two-component system OmpR family response regulator
MSEKGRILVIEDEPTIAELVAIELRLEGYDVQVETDGLKGLLAARQNEPDLILLDWMLPGMEGLEVCRRLRQTSEVPILFLTAKGEVPDRVAALYAGANDYLPKPFSFDELIARIHAQLRAHKPRPRTRFEFEDLSLDTGTRIVERGGETIDLTPKEFDLLAYLLRHPRQVRTREQILMAVWGYDFNGEDNVLDVYIRQLRVKIERPERQRLIHTVRGVGYVLRAG